MTRTGDCMWLAKMSLDKRMTSDREKESGVRKKTEKSQAENDENKN